MRLVAYRPFLAQATNTVLSQQTPVENPPYDAQNMKYAVAVPSGTNASMRLSIMVAIFFVSLFAASFPTLSKRVRYLNIPRVVFFLGKHFGTGVILSTAFVHLLQDAFESLLDPKVQEETSVGHWAGLIILSSLLLIFLIEYTSTSFVDHLHSYPSAPPSPKLEGSDHPTVIQPTESLSQPSESTSQFSESTPLLFESVRTPRRHTIADPVHAHTTHLHTHDIFQGHHRYESRLVHAEHHEQPRRSVVLLDGPDPAPGPLTVGRARKPASSVQNGHGRCSGHNHGLEHGHSHADLEGLYEDGQDCECAADDEGEMEIGQRRQIVGILVLQFGIMIHSLVIGLTLAIASGADFTSLVAAISFHQLFEGLSLGIRIAALPAPRDGPSHLVWLKPVLAILFAITTPVGITIGLLSFGAAGSGGVRLKVIEGLMSAISAGMLIYAACVEMLAGDFVLDPTLWRSGFRRQLLALVSLVAGATAMALLGLVS